MPAKWCSTSWQLPKLPGGREGVFQGGGGMLQQEAEWEEGATSEVQFHEIQSLHIRTLLIQNFYGSPSVTGLFFRDIFTEIYFQSFYMLAF